jgi:hypothetical protein
MAAQYMHGIIRRALPANSSELLICMSDPCAIQSIAYATAAVASVLRDVCLSDDNKRRFLLIFVLYRV